MKNKLLKKTIFIKLLTGIVLILYVINSVYTYSTTAVPLDVIPFMACCVGIVIAGFALAALCECFANKKYNYQTQGTVIRQLVEGAVIAGLITIICVIIYVV